MAARLVIGLDREVEERPHRSTQPARTCRVGTAFVLACACSIANAAAAQHRIDSWTTADGLPQNSVNGIVQTRDGFLWLATFGGLVRYDGVSFEVFNPGTTQGLTTSRFLRPFEDDDGNLWITTESAGVVRHRDGVFTTYTTQQGLPGNYVVDVAHDRRGALVAGSPEAAARFEDGRFVPYVPPDGERFSRPMHRTRSGALWHADGTGLHRHENGRVTRRIATGFQVAAMFEDRRGRLWMGTREDELVSLVGGELQAHRVPGLPKVTVNRFCEDRHGALWISIAGGGLLRIADGEMTRYTMADGLASDDVTPLYEDREGNLWVGTAGGLNRLTPRVVTAYSTADGLAADNTYPILEDRRGDVWIGSWRGLSVYRDGTFARVDERYGVGGRLIMSLHEDREGSLLIGTWGDGAKRIADGRTTSLLPRDGVPVRIVRAIHQDRTGAIWFGASNGLARSRGGAFDFFTTEDGLSGNTIHVIFEDRRGDLWFGTEAGLTRYSGGRFSAEAGVGGPAGHLVRAIHEDAAGTLWVGTYDAGLFRLRDGRFTRYTTAEGLFDNGVFQLLEDARGFFWVSCNRGLYRVRRQELNDLAEGRIARVVSVSYGRPDGMLSTECNGGGQPAGIAARDGRLWFPTQRGVVVVDPAAVPVNSQPPPVVIEEVRIGRDPVGFDGGVRVLPGQESFEVRYAGLSFVKPEQVRFKYRLDGLDTGWVDADTRRIAYYTHVPPGRYRFTIVAANTDGVWNHEGASVEVVVVPPFWGTWWFRAAVAAALAAAAVALFRRRVGRLERAHAAREAFSRRLIETQEEERRRIAAELHDSLGQDLILIKNWALLGLGAVAAGGPPAEQLREISDTASQAIGEVREIAYNLGPYQLERLGLTRSIEDMLEKVAASSGIRFPADIAHLDGALPRESEINLYRVVQEAVNNAVKHSGASEAALTITSDARQLRVMVRDDGKGFDTEAHYRMRAAAGRGFGLTGMAERVRLLGGTWEIRSAPGMGTSIDIHIPLQGRRNGAGGRHGR